MIAEFPGWWTCFRTKLSHFICGYMQTPSCYCWLSNYSKNFESSLCVCSCFFRSLRFLNNNVSLLSWQTYSRRIPRSPLAKAVCKRSSLPRQETAPKQFEIIRESCSCHLYIVCRSWFYFKGPNWHSDHSCQNIIRNALRSATPLHSILASQRSKRAHVSHCSLLLT